MTASSKPNRFACDWVDLVLVVIVAGRVTLSHN